MMKHTFVSFRKIRRRWKRWDMVYAGKDFNKRNAATERLFKNLTVSFS